jgi:hypothetical protein
MFMSTITLKSRITNLLKKSHIHLKSPGIKLQNLAMIYY